MKIKNLKTNLEGQPSDRQFWNKLIETATPRGEVYLCRRTMNPCRDIYHHNCVYQEHYKVEEEK